MSRLTSFIDKARRLESALAAGVDDLSRRVTQSSGRQPLETIVAVVDAIEQEIQPAGRDRRAFPFTHIHVQVAAGSPAVQARFEMLIQGPPSLRERIVERLEEAGCVVPALAVDVSFTTEAQPDWTHAEFDLQFTRASAAPPEPAPPARLELTVTHGTAERTVYVFETAPIALGRGDEVRDGRQRLLRTNQVVFSEGAGDVNQSVSRQHARIEYVGHDAAAGAYRLFDDGSAQGTSVIRRGRGFAVPRGTKGLRLQPGDEIVLGQARLRVKIETTVAPRPVCPAS